MLAPLTCGVVMLISGVAKVGKPTATREAFMSMGVPQALRSETLVTSLPYVEIALGVLLLATWSWPLAVVAAATTALFATYWVLVLRVLLRGEEVDCGCFGALGDDRVSGTTLARNSVLVVLAALATAFGAAGSGVLPAVADFGTADWWWLLLSVAVAATAVLVVGLRRPEDVVADDDLLDYERAPIPFALLEDESGTRVTLQAAGRRTPPAVAVPEHLSAGPASRSRRSSPSGCPSSARSRSRRCSPSCSSDVPDKLRQDGVRMWFDVEQGATDTFASGRPSAVLLGADGALAGGPVTGADAVVTFVEEIVAELSAAQDLPMRRARARLHRRPGRRARHATGTTRHPRDDGHGHA